MSWLAIPIESEKRDSDKACASCGTFYRAVGENVCQSCLEINRMVSTAHRRGDPEQGYL